LRDETANSRAHIETERDTQFATVPLGGTEHLYGEAKILYERDYKTPLGVSG